MSTPNPLEGPYSFYNAHTWPTAAHVGLFYARLKNFQKSKIILQPIDFFCWGVFLMMKTPIDLVSRGRKNFFFKARLKNFQKFLSRVP